MSIRELTPVKNEFYRQDVIDLARNLLGKYFVKSDSGQLLAGKIVETEAYHEEGDESCRASRGKTSRNEVMFGPPGVLYVYFTYGMHYCMNIVAEGENTAVAILIRAMEPVQGIDTMIKNRGGKHDLYNLASGPAKLCQAFGIDKKYNGYNLTGGNIFIADAPPIAEKDIVVAKRIGISKAVDHPWRFYIRGSKFVSKKQ